MDECWGEMGDPGEALCALACVRGVGGGGKLCVGLGGKIGKVETMGGVSAMGSHPHRQPLFFLKLIYLFIYLIFGCIGSSLLHRGLL